MHLILITGKIFTVLQIFFEDNPKIIQRKHFTMWTGIAPDDLSNHREVVIEKVKEIKLNTKNTLTLKKMPSDTMTMNQIKNQVRKMMGMSEEKKKEQNPWAICTAQLGKEFGTRERHLWSAKEKNKYERCVKDVKKSLKEGKNPVSLFLENEIMRIVEKNLPPRITKGDLLKYLSEAGPATAPTKPAPGTKPSVKPGKPDTRPRPKHPGKNPNPGENPAPKAKKVSPEVAKL